MFNEIIKEIHWSGERLAFKTGKIARQADASVVVEFGQTQVLCAVSTDRKTKENIDFFPLSVHYREMAYAVGRIPGGFVKSEGKPSDREALVARLIDRAIRPLFPAGFFHEVQIICTVLSSDSNCGADITAMLGAYAALAISGLPLMDELAAVRVGLIGDKFVLNHALNKQGSSLDLIVAGTSSSIMMVESESDQLPFELLLEAIKFGHDAISPVLDLIKELKLAAGKAPWTLESKNIAEIESLVSQNFGPKIRHAFSIDDKKSQQQELDRIYAEICKTLEESHDPRSLYLAFKNSSAKVLRSLALEGKRVDGRKLEQIRQISCEVGLLARPHGSALFTRGETQVLAAITLGGSEDEQVVEFLDQDIREHFLLQYIFPSYSVNETAPPKASSRREIGHSKLALRAIKTVLPSKASFPYTIRSVAEVTSCDGSTSMAAICGSILALMDAGVPITNPVAGIAMGLVKNESSYVILSDIMAAEDFLGDMDLKVAGTKKGITALQMDIKIKGITLEIIGQALQQAHQGILSILSDMHEVISAPKASLSKYAPVIKNIKIKKEKIKELIGPGGKIIKEICETTNTKINISENGDVKISGIGSEAVDMAVEKILSIGIEPEIGVIYEAMVTKIIEIGVIVKFFDNKESLIHINDIFITKGQDLNSYFKLGDKLQVRFTGYDNKKRCRVTMRIEGSEKIKEDKEPEPELISEIKHFN
jgi:polyribonucleotide nucleotidyltransferase